MKVNPQIFKAYDIRGRVPDELDANLSYQIGKAYADFLSAPGEVAVGIDMRPESAELAQSFIKALVEQGRDVIEVGLVTTDMVYFAVGKYNLAGGVMITGSHNPGIDNGIKLYREGVQPIGLDSGLDAIRDAVIDRQFKPVAAQPGRRKTQDITEDWVQHVLSFINMDQLKPYKIGIDAGNGMAGAILPRILPHLPFEITPLYFELDGNFPNHEANPMKPENLVDLAKVVRDKKLDFGLAFDGDGDRAAFVEQNGVPISGSVLIGLVAGYVLKTHPGASIVHEVRTTRGATEWIKKCGGQPVRAKAGRVNIGPVMVAKQAPFGGETTGHLFFKDNFYADSGLIGALVAIAALADSGQTFSEVVKKLQPYAIVPEINFTVEDKASAIERLASEFNDGEQDRLDGLTVNYPDWWFNIRPSNTEPVMRLNIEAATKAQLDDAVAKITALVQNPTPD